MRPPRISDAQMELLATRLAAVGIGRRDFLKVAAGLASMGAPGFDARPVSAAPKLEPGEKLAREQHVQTGGGSGRHVQKLSNICQMYMFPYASISCHTRSTSSRLPVIGGSSRCFSSQGKQTPGRTRVLGHPFMPTRFCLCAAQEDNSLGGVAAGGRYEPAA